MKPEIVWTKKPIWVYSSSPHKWDRNNNEVWAIEVWWKPKVDRYSGIGTIIKYVKSLCSERKKCFDYQFCAGQNETSFTCNYEYNFFKIKIEKSESSLCYENTAYKNQSIDTYVAM